jgi:DDE superfamily endonuclease
MSQLADRLACKAIMPLPPTKTFKTWRQRVRLIESLHAGSMSTRGAAKEWGVQEKMLRNWKKKIESKQASLASLPAAEASCRWSRFLKSRIDQKERSLKTDEAYMLQLDTFYRQQRSLGYKVFDSDLVSQLHVILYPPESDTEEPTEKLSDEALRSRIRRWRERLGIVRRATHVGQRTEFDPDIIRGFVDAVNEEIVTRGIPMDCIVNMDETNMYFDQQGRMTLADKGQKTVNIVTTGSSQRCTIALAASLSGEKLPPMVIFKGVPGARGNSVANELATLGYPSTATYTVQKKAWMDIPTFLQWVEEIWRPFCAGRPKTLLILDVHKAHMATESLAALQECGTEVMFIPPGYTSKLQAMDVGVNKPYKGYARERYFVFLRARLTVNETPHRYDVACWVVEAWAKVSVDTILNTWRHIGIVALENRENVDPNGPGGALDFGDGDDEAADLEMELLANGAPGNFQFQGANDEMLDEDDNDDEGDYENDF